MKVNICRGSKYEKNELEERIKRIEEEIHHIKRLDEMTYGVETKLNKAVGARRAKSS